MDTQKLSCGAKEFLTVLVPNDVLRKEAEECILHYTAPSSHAPLMERVKYVAFRIINILKGLFGCSEWQRTVKRLGGHTIVLFNPLKLAAYNIRYTFLEIALGANECRWHKLPDKLYDLVREIFHTKHKQLPKDKQIPKDIVIKGEEFSNLPLCDNCQRV